MSNGIDFVITGKNAANAAFDGVLASLQAVNKTSESLGKTFATASGGLAKAIGTLAQSAAKSVATIATGAADAYGKVIIASAKTAKIESTIKPQLDSLQKSFKGVEEQSKRTAKATETLTSMSKGLVGVYVAIKGAVAALGGLNAINAAYDSQAEAVKRLNAALAIRGVQSMSGPMQQAAKDLEKLTGVSDNATLSLMHQAQGMGFAADRMDDAAKAATGLAAATGKDAAASLGDLKSALEGNFDAFYAVNPQIRFMASNQQKLAAVMAIASQGLQQQSQDMGTVAGSGRRADSAMATLMETFGSILAPIRVLINAGIQQLSESLTTILAPAAEYASEVLAKIGPWMDWLKEKIVAGINIIVSAWTMFEVVLGNLSSVWDVAVAYAEMSLIAIKENVMHVLTVAIPSYAEWFAQNFVKVFKDAFTAVITVFQNGGKMIAEMSHQIFEFVKWGFSGGVSGLMETLSYTASQGLIKGFEISLTQLPEIAERQLSQREKDLAEKIGAIGGRLGQEFSDKMSERMLGVGSELGSELEAATKNISLQGRPAVITQGNAATEGRLLTRGPGTRIPDLLQQMNRTLTQIRDKIQPVKGPRLVPQI